MSRNKKWSPTDITRLEFMAKNNFTTSVIAEQLDRTIDAIYNKASDEGISLKPKDE